jgi:hypothetical protein
MEDQQHKSHDATGDKKQIIMMMEDRREGGQDKTV